MKVLVTGVTGQLGYDVVRELKERGHIPFGVSSNTMDITDYSMVEKVMQEEKPEAVIHCAAYTAVDEAEENVELCRSVNAKGTENIAKICKDFDIKMIYISTDYVFSGEGQKSWCPEDVAHPLNTYGMTKYEGELAVQKFLDKYFIVRISWVFGINGKNFVKTMLRLGKTNGTVNVVNDQVGSPTYTYDLSKLLCDMLVTEEYGIYHATNEGMCSWYEFACEIFKVAGLDVKVHPVDSNAFPSIAKRPHNSRMNTDKLESYGFNRLPDWKDALARYIDSLEKEQK